MIPILLALLAGPDPYALAEQAGRLQASDPARSAELWRQVQAAAPGNARVDYELGRALTRAGRRAEGVAALGRAADAGLSADLAELRRDLGEAAAYPDVAAVLERLERNGQPLGESQVLALLPERDLMPESLAVDPRDGTLYVGSIYKRKLVRRSPDGVVSDFVPSGRDGLGAVLGIKLDAARRQLVVNSCHGGGTVVASPDPHPPGAGLVHVFDLADARLVARFVADAPVCFNDLVVTPQGDVYATSGPDGIWRLERSTGRLERWLAPEHAWTNGIALAADGRTLYVSEALSGVLAVDVATRRVEPVQTPPGATLAGIDGLYLHAGTTSGGLSSAPGPASLVAIQNGLGSPDRVVQAFLDPGGRRVTALAVLEQAHPLFDIPTTGALLGERLVYLGASQLAAVTDGRMWGPERLRDVPILSLRLRAGPGAPPVTADLAAERAALLRLHEHDRQAHFATDVTALLEGQGDSLLTVAAGKIEERSTEDQARRFRDYFAGATFTRWDDLEPPRVSVSSDGSQAYVITRLRVERTQKRPDGSVQEHSFVYAGIMTYEKRDGRWVRAANVSTFE